MKDRIEYGRAKTIALPVALMIQDTAEGYKLVLSVLCWCVVLRLGKKVANG